MAADDTRAPFSGGGGMRSGETNTETSGRNVASHAELPTILTATPADFDQAITPESGELVVVYFWGPDCPNCDVFAAHFPNLLEQLRGAPLRLVKVNAYEHPELATRFGLFGIPNFLLFRDGRKIGRMSEFRGDAWWLGVVRDHLPTADRLPAAE